MYLKIWNVDFALHKIKTLQYSKSANVQTYCENQQVAEGLHACFVYQIKSNR
jgi:hypothetical protein